MGCSPSSLTAKRPAADADAAVEPAAESQKLHAFVPKTNYVRPSFAAAYARAVRRYHIGQASSFAFRDDRVVRLAGADTTHEVPAESIQNEYVVFWCRS
jgi:hypothetical protein